MKGISLQQVKLVKTQNQPHEEPLPYVDITVAHHITDKSWSVYLDFYPPLYLPLDEEDRKKMESSIAVLPQPLTAPTVHTWNGTFTIGEIEGKEVYFYKFPILFFSDFRVKEIAEDELEKFIQSLTRGLSPYRPLTDLIGEFVLNQTPLGRCVKRKEDNPPTKVVVSVLLKVSTFPVADNETAITVYLHTDLDVYVDLSGYTDEQKSRWIGWFGEISNLLSRSKLEEFLFRRISVRLVHFVSSDAVGRNLTSSKTLQSFRKDVDMLPLTEDTTNGFIRNFYPLFEELFDVSLEGRWEKREFVRLSKDDEMRLWEAIRRLIMSMVMLRERDAVAVAERLFRRSTPPPIRKILLVVRRY